jgi:hypothetical protein
MRLRNLNSLILILLLPISEVFKINQEIKLVEVSSRKSSQSEPGTQKQEDRRKEPVRGEKSSQKPYGVLRVAFAIALLGRFFVRDFSPLRPVMVQGKWEGVVNRNFHHFCFNYSFILSISYNSFKSLLI